MDRNAERVELRRHELSQAIPVLSTDEYTALRESIRRDGLRDAIWLRGGEILDGWHRYLACLETGVEPSFREYAGDRPARFVLAQQRVRRTWTSSMAAAAAVALEPVLLAEEAWERRPEGGAPCDSLRGVRHPNGRDHKVELEGRSDTLVARAAGTNRMYVSDFKVIERSDAALAEKIRSGDVTITRAKRILLGHGEQESSPLSRFSGSVDAESHEVVSTEGHVYLLRSDATGWSKIGYSIDPERRLEELQNEWPELGWQLVASAFSADCAMVEAKLHRIFALRRVARGREWFRLSVDEVERFEALVASLSTTEVLG